MPHGRLLAGLRDVRTRARVIARAALVWIVIVVVATARAGIRAHALPAHALLTRGTLGVACPAVQRVALKINLASVVADLVAIRIAHHTSQHITCTRYTRKHHIPGSDRTGRQRLSCRTVVSTLAAVTIVLVDVRAIRAAHYSGRIARILDTTRLRALVARRTRVTTGQTVLGRAQARLTSVLHVAIAIGIFETRASRLAAPVETRRTCAVELAVHPGTDWACVPARAAVERIVVETRLADMARARTRGVRHGAFIARTHRRFSGSRRAVCACVRGVLEAGGRPVRFVGVCPERGTGRGARAIPENKQERYDKGRTRSSIHIELPRPWSPPRCADA